ncbi:unnamed protein product [Diamesa tonsa]
MISTKREDDRRIQKMPQSSSVLSPYNKITEFSSKTKVICTKTDLSMFMESCKAIFVGDISTGKTSLINRFTRSTFEYEYKSTIGIDFETEYFRILDVEYNLQIWDSAGQERFKCIAKSYYRNANAIVVVHDLTRPSTLKNSITWLKDALQANERNEPYLFLVGTKCDLLSRRALEAAEKEAEAIAHQMNAEHISVSAREGTNVVNLFKRLTALAFESSVQKLITPPDYNLIRNNIINLGAFKKEEKSRKYFGKCLSGCRT